MWLGELMCELVETWWMGELMMQSVGNGMIAGGLACSMGGSISEAWKVPY